MEKYTKVEQQWTPIGVLERAIFFAVNMINGFDMTELVMYVEHSTEQK